MIRGTISASTGRYAISWPIAAAVQPPPPARHPHLSQTTPGGESPPRPGRPPERGRTLAGFVRKPVLVLASVAIGGAHRHGASRNRGCHVGPASGRRATICAAGTLDRRGRSGPPARPPSSARPSRSARPGTSPADTSTVPVVVSKQRSITGFVSGGERMHRHRDGSDIGRGHGNGNRRGHGHRNGHGEGNGNGHENGHGQGKAGTATATATGTGTGTGTRRSSAFQVSRLAEVPA